MGLGIGLGSAPMRQSLAGSTATVGFALLLLVSCSNAAQSADQSDCRAAAQSYWGKFRSAALAGDAGKIVSLVAGPVQVRGELDSNTPATLARSQIGNTLVQRLGDDTGLREQNYTQRSLINDTPQLTEIDCTQSDGQFRIGNFQFHFRGGIWSLEVIFTGE